MTIISCDLKSLTGPFPQVIFIVGFCFFLTIFIVVYYSAWAIVWVIETLCVEIWMLSLWVDGYWTRSEAEAEAKDEDEDEAMADRQKEVRRRWARKTGRGEWREEGVRKRRSGGSGLRGERGERQMEKQEKEAPLGSDGSISEVDV